MSCMLASVNSLEEARLVRDYKVGIIDLKQPEQGALGALDVEVVASIVAGLKSAVPVSATVGDLPMRPELVFDAVQAMAATGVDYVKIGFFPGGDWLGTVAGLVGIARQGHALIAVLFADTRPDLSVIDALSEAGFRGVMLDTMNKQLGSLTKLMSHDELSQFVTMAKSRSLLTGLAGSLTVADIAELLPLNADYLGFRGALCQQHRRTGQLDTEQIALISSMLRA